MPLLEEAMNQCSEVYVSFAWVPVFVDITPVILHIVPLHFGKNKGRILHYIYTCLYIQNHTLCHNIPLPASKLHVYFGNVLYKLVRFVLQCAYNVHIQFISSKLVEKRCNVPTQSSSFLQLPLKIKLNLKFIIIDYVSVLFSHFNIHDGNDSGVERYVPDDLCDISPNRFWPVNGLYTASKRFGT